MGFLNNLFTKKNNGIVLVTLLVFISSILIIIVTSLFLYSNISSSSNNSSNSILVKSKLESATEDFLITTLRNPNNKITEKTIYVDNVAVYLNISYQDNIVTVNAYAENNSYYHNLVTTLNTENNKIIVESYKIY